MTTQTLANFLLTRSTKAKDSTTKVSHTRIGCMENKIYGGKFAFSSPEDEAIMYDLLYKEIVVGTKMEYLTEKQFKDDVIYIDLDFRYNIEVPGRMHGEEWTQNILCCYLEHIKKLLNIERGVQFPIYVLQKDGINRLSDGSFAKDGVHIIIKVKMPNVLQMELRKRMMEDAIVKELLSELPLINSAEKVFDDGLSKGTTNAQIYGCRKPSNQPYKLVKCYMMELDDDDEWIMNTRNTTMTKELFLDLSVRHGTKVEFPLSDLGNAIANPVQAARVRQETQHNAKFEDGDDVANLMKLLSGDRCASGEYEKAFKVRQALKNAVGDNGKDFYRQYTQRAYDDGQGSFNKMTDWEKEWDAVPEIDPPPPQKKLTIKSLHYWAKDDSPADYARLFPTQNGAIKDKDAREWCEKIIESPTDFNFAKLFQKLYGNEFKCVDVKNKTFYAFTKDKLWEKDDGGTPIRNLMSMEMNQSFAQKLTEMKMEMKNLKTNGAPEDALKVHKEAMKNVTYAIDKLENTVSKNNILTPISDLLKDVKFAETMNKQEYVLPILNKKVLNMQTLKVSDRTIDHKFDYECDANYRDLTEPETADIKNYFDGLFCGHEDTTQVVLDILKSAMTGKTLRYIYFLTGEGRNGKSALFNILKSIFKGGMDTISKDAILLKKGNSSNINTEVEKLDKCRIGFASELREEDVLNTTIIKAITGGDGIDLRALQKTNVTITPTANLFLLTNELPQFKVEQAIKDRLIVIPFKNRFDVNKQFEKNMIEKREQVFSYIMKHGKINEDKFKLTEEMKIAKEEYEEENVKDYLQDFIENSYEKCVGKKVERDYFKIDYNEYCKKRGYKMDYSTNTKFTRKMKTIGFKSDKSGGKTYYLNLRPKDKGDLESEPENA